MTTQELTTQELTSIGDGFDECCEPLGGGDFIKFDANTETKWFYRDGSPLPRRQYVPVDCRVELVRWCDKQIMDRIVQRPDEPFPDVDELNEAIPKSEWEEDFNGNPRGPWQLQRSIFFVDPNDGSRLISSNSTFGQKLAYEEIKSKIQFMRQARGCRVFPLIEFSSKQMKTRFGVKARPYFDVKDWQTFGSSSPAAITGPRPATSAEIIDDEIRDLPF
jgi:hypothetical protein